jgi:hypothetical protein
MELPPTDFESAASASSAIPALQIDSLNKRHLQPGISSILLVQITPASRQLSPNQRPHRPFQYRTALSTDSLASPIRPKPSRPANPA